MEAIVEKHILQELLITIMTHTESPIEKHIQELLMVSDHHIHKLLTDITLLSQDQVVMVMALLSQDQVLMVMALFSQDQVLMVITPLFQVVNIPELHQVVTTLLFQEQAVIITHQEFMMVTTQLFQVHQAE